MIFAPRCLSLVPKPYLDNRPTSIRKRHGVFALMPLLFICIKVAVAGMPVAPCNTSPTATQNSLRRILDEWPLRGSGDYLSQYVHKLGIQLASRSNYANPGNWNFSIVRNFAPNAFSIGSGYIFVTDGAVRFVQNDSELAAILAHEIGHELAGHFCQQAAVGSGGLFDLFNYPRSGQNHVGVGSLTQVIDPVKEKQADAIAVSLLRSGGYDPRALLDVALRLPSNTALHHLNADRIHYLQNALANFPPVYSQTSLEFLAVKRNLDNEQ